MFVSRAPENILTASAQVHYILTTSRLPGNQTQTAVKSFHTSFSKPDIVTKIWSSRNSRLICDTSNLNFLTWHGYKLSVYVPETTNSGPKAFTNCFRRPCLICNGTKKTFIELESGLNFFLTNFELPSVFFWSFVSNDHFLLDSPKDTECKDT